MVDFAKLSRHKKLARELLPLAKREIESQLPEDEPDFTAEWVYLAVIELVLRKCAP